MITINLQWLAVIPGLFAAYYAVYTLYCLYYWMFKAREIEIIIAAGATLGSGTAVLISLGLTWLVYMAFRTI